MASSLAKSEIRPQNELQPSDDDQQNRAGNSGTSAHLASSLAKSEIRPQSVPKQQTQWDIDGPKEPQVPTLTALTEQIVHFDGAASEEGPENVASFVDGHHSQPSKRNGRADEEKLVSLPHGGAQ